MSNIYRECPCCGTMVEKTKQKLKANYDGAVMCMETMMDSTNSKECTVSFDIDGYHFEFKAEKVKERELSII